MSVIYLLCGRFSQLHDSSPGRTRLFFHGRASTQIKASLQEQQPGLFCVQAFCSISLTYDEAGQPD